MLQAGIFDRFVRPPATPTKKIYCNNSNENNNKSISIAPWLQVTLFKGTDTKKLKNMIIMLKVKGKLELARLSLINIHV